MGHWLLESSSETGRIHYRTEDLGAVTCKERESESGQPEHPVPCECLFAAERGLVVGTAVMAASRSETRNRDGCKFGFSSNPRACLRRQWLQTGESSDLG